MSDPKTAVDIGAAAIVGLSWTQILPNVAAILSIVWFIIRICETKTIRKWLKKDNG